jgi:acetyl-CoA carboxylase biotin carboxyl carrier protein
LPFEPEDIRELASILEETGLTEIEVSEKDRRIRIARQPAPQSVAVAAPVAAAPVAAAALALPARTVDATEPDASHPGAVASPMVGVAYLSPEPDSPPFVTIGQRVEAGQTLLLIEAMKTFNQIKAPRAGTLSRVIIRTGSPVEFGELLMIVD